MLNYSFSSCKKSRIKVFFERSIIAAVVAGLIVSYPKRIEKAAASSKKSEFITDTLPPLSYAKGPLEAPGEAFKFKASALVKNNTPLISELTENAGGDEHIIFSGDKLTTSDGSDAMGKIWNGRTLVSSTPAISENGLAIENGKAIYKIPQKFGEHTFGVMWLKNINGYGRPVKLNATQVWWAQEKVIAGTTAGVYGRNLSYNNDTLTSYVYVKSISTNHVKQCKVISVNPYRIQYDVPPLAKGDYELWVHNGSGGQFNWSKNPVNITVWAGMRWNESNSIKVQELVPGDSTAANANAKAINKAIRIAHQADNYKTVQLPAGIFYINSQISPGWKVRLKGASGGSAKLNTLKTIIRTTSHFRGRLMEAGNNEEFQLEDIFFDIHGTYAGGHLFHLRGGKHLTFKNVRVFAKYDNSKLTSANWKNIPLLDCHQKEYVVIEDCHLIGGQLDFVCGKNYLIQNTSFRPVNASVTCMYPWGAENVAITNCDVQDYGTDIQETGRGRFYTMSGLWSSNKFIYIGHNVGRNLGVHPDFSDKNQGEVIMSEGNACKFEGSPIAATSNTVTFASKIPQRSTTEKYNTYHLTVIKGKGEGQVIEVLSSKGNTYNLKQSWKVIPDTGSIILVNSGTHYLVAYKNKFTQKPYIAKAGYGIASAAIEPFGGCSHWVTDNNIFIGFQNALFNFPTKHKIGHDPNLWIEWLYNYVDGKGANQGYNSYLVKTEPHKGPKVLGELLRGNKITNVQTAYSAQGSSSNSGYDVPVMEYVVAEHNMMATPMKNIESMAKPPISTSLVNKQVFYKNEKPSAN